MFLSLELYFSVSLTEQASGNATLPGPYATPRFAENEVDRSPVLSILAAAPSLLVDRTRCSRWVRITYGGESDSG
jgi:hypothetical protein